MDILKSFRSFRLKIGATKTVEQKSLPVPAIISAGGYLTAPGPMSHNPVELLQHNQGIVYTCNRINAQTIASIPYKLYATKGSGRKALGEWVKTAKLDYHQNKWVRKMLAQKEAVVGAEEIVEITEHPVLDLLGRANDLLDTFTFFELIESYLGLIGNAFVQIVSDSDGVPIELQVLPAEYISPKLDSTGKLIGWIMAVDGVGSTEFARDEVIHFKQPSAGAFRRVQFRNQALTGLLGMGHLEGCLDEAILMEEITQHCRAVSRNLGRPDYAIVYQKGQVEQKTKEMLSRHWQQIFRRNSGKPVVLDNDAKIQQLGFSPVDMDYAEGRKWLRNSICSAFGIPDDLISTENSNRATALQMLDSYMRFTVLPKLTRIQEALNATLLPKYDDNLYLCFDSPLPADLTYQAKMEDQDVKNGIRSVNEIRVSRGMEPLEGDEYDRPHKSGAKVETTEDK